MGKIVAIVNQKGGVGKTTTAINLSAAVGMLGHKVLLVDIDPQGNSTSGYGINKREVKKSTYDMIIGEESAKNIVIKTKYKNVDILPANMNLAGAEIELVEMSKRESRLKMALAPIEEDYEYIFLDCPPSLGVITLNALVAADTVFVPIQCEYYALEGLSQLMSSIRTTKRKFNPHLELDGILFTMFDSRLNLTSQVVREVKQYFPKKVYTTVIPRNVRLSEAPSYGEPICYYDASSKGAKSYNQLAKEYIRKSKREV